MLIYNLILTVLFYFIIFKHLVDDVEHSFFMFIYEVILHCGIDLADSIPV